MVRRAELAVAAVEVAFGSSGRCPYTTGLLHKSVEYDGVFVRTTFVMNVAAEVLEETLGSLEGLGAVAKDINASHRR